ncbi:hypothetical protein V5P93_003288 [Actinokineospora auranticolor]|uniref:Allene oxide cyclase barrel-like domain-containing protein n=1 Tax=Actinokineospora auranticolor TaxID=155976 RepID=A0A2S6H1S2_9PSEU|nr:hypothetical protein [Actinokineospora auranticolor]PPK71422.1 hypothetical protein CLV40_101612 [Actinokineospora auranticolor]
MTAQHTEPAARTSFDVPPETASDRVAGLLDPSAVLVLRDLTEKVVAYESNNPDPTGETPTEHDFATVELEIFAGDTRIGRTKGAGRMLYKQGSGTFLAYFGETITLDDGNVIRAGGLVDDGRLTGGEWASFPATVVEGPLAGAVGYRTFRPVANETHRVYESAIVLYRA